MAAREDRSTTGGVRQALLSLLGAAVIRTLRATVRLRYHDDAEVRSWERDGRRFLLAFWHRHLLLMRYAYRGDRMTVLVSRSRDGELISRVMARLGVETSRGSSSRGGALGLRDLLRRAREGSDIAVTPDGPRGPLRKAQPGVVLAAAASGLPLVPVAIEASRARLLSSWDRMVVPLPGSRVEVVYGPPIRVPRGADAEQWAPRIEQALNETERRAGRIARGERVDPS
ncbi:MAG TPA: lysophospholipid acyltransferase family protein [Thermoanaerobaculia bacterium]|nr:lysophospholipid acyltransferase family protein [Thermoanaerobaculia bacterium]